MTGDKIPSFLKEVEGALLEEQLVRLVLSAPRGKTDLVRVTVRPVMLKAGLRFAFTYRHKTRDIVKNLNAPETVTETAALLDETFKNATLFTSGFDLSYPAMRRTKATLTPAAPEHDRAKTRHVETAGKPYLRLLGLTDEKGAVLKSAQDKYRQVDKYVEIVAGLLKDVDLGTIKSLVDMGSGKGYLTFALADYLRNAAGIAATVTGVEARADMVELCNNIAQQSGMDNLSFARGTIADYTGSPNVLIALHACDTATDDALWLGVKSGAAVIVAAPCCHKQVRRAIDSKSGSAAALTRHGIFEERLAEMATDAIRAAILEYHGYDVKVFEFVALEHTAKNVMITAVRARKDRSDAARAKIRSDIKSIKGVLGVTAPQYLETLAGL